MAVIGGDIRKITAQHPTVGTAVFYGVSGESSTYMLGGMQNTDTGKVDGAGRLLNEKMMIPGSIELTVSNDMSAPLPELEFVQRCTKATQECKFTVEHINGTAYGGSGLFVGDYSLDGKASTFKLKIQSGKGFERL